ncbi:hypothetical protein CSIM01_11188 [Colletotrichum simmondsii]|uniref:Uncharacterized protein n=1 Tax=Colletotrichum simmondsii TaxID=703756 RepID=A0A135SH47_9PEZI|nr:hypothetical protein CSIM01_11188 [Colletotrichum simmondsii]
MVYNITSVPWSPPQNVIWNVTLDCALFANLANTIMRTSDTPNYCNIDNHALHALIIHFLEVKYSGGFQNGTLQQIASWYLSGCSSIATPDTCDVEHCSSAVDFKNATIAELGKSAGMFCFGELRSSLGIQGNADIAGVGVMVTFFLEASLVVGFFIAHAAEYARKQNPRSTMVFSDPLNIYESLTGAFKAVLPTFFWSSVLLSLGIVTSSVVTAAAAAGDGQDNQLAQWRAGEDFTVYDSQLSALASLFSIQATLMASLMLEEPTRWRRVLAWTVLPMLWALLVGLISLTVLYTAQLPNDVQRLLQKTLKSDKLVRVFLQVSISATNFMMAVCGMTAFVVMYWDKTPVGQGKHVSTPEPGKDDALPDLKTGKNKPSLNQTDGEEKQLPIRPAGEGERSLPPKNDVGGSSPTQTASDGDQPKRSPMTAKKGSSSTGETGKEELQSARLLAAEIGVVQTILMGMMLATLGIFFHFREQTINSGVAGDPQLDWSFGQIVVLTTWVPVIIDIWWTLLVGMKKSFKRHMPIGFKAFAKENLEMLTKKIKGGKQRAVETVKKQISGLRIKDEAERQTSEAENQAPKIRACDGMQGTLEGGGVEEKSEQDV